MTTSSGSAHDRGEHAGSATMMCAGLELGLGLHPIQRLAAIATPSQWRDAVVASVASDGTIELVDLDSGDHARVWHFADLTSVIAVGEPVSLHAQYGVLAVGRLYVSVRAI